MDNVTTKNAKLVVMPKALSRWFSDDGLTKKAYLNAFASALDYGARLVVGFVLNPILVSGLGAWGYGAWQVLSRLSGYLGPAGGRSAQALKWTIANQQSSSDYEQKRRHVGSTLVIWLMFLPLLLVLGAVLAWFAPLWLSAPEELVPGVRLAAAVLVANVILITLVDVPRSALTGQNLGYKRMGLSALLVCVGGALVALALYLNTGLVGVAVATVVSTLLTGGLFLFVARAYVPWFGVARPSATGVRSFLGLSGWFIGWAFIMRLMTASDVVILGLLDSAELVTTYTLTKYVPETIVSFVAIVVFGITPGLGGIVGSGDLAKASRLRTEIMSLTWLMLTVIGTTTLLWNESFVGLWVGAEYYAGPVHTLLIMVMVAQFVIIRNDANIIDLTLDLRHKVLLGLLSTAVSLLIASVLVGVYDLGIIGLCAGLIAGRLILSVSYPWLVGRLLDFPLRAQLPALTKPVLVTATLFAGVAAFGAPLEAESWPVFVLCITLTAATVSLVAMYAGLSHATRRQLFLRVKRVAAS